MTLDARLFVTTAGCDDRAAALALRRRLQERLKDWYARKHIAGYEVVVALVEEDYDEYDLDRESIERVTGGALPFVYANVTFDPQNAERPDLSDDSELVREFSLRAVA